MMRKDIKWNWGERQQRAFQELKERFTMEPVLVTLDLNKEMRVEIDISYLAMGEVLSMKCGNEKQRLVAYISKLLNEVKRNYEIHDKEMLAIIKYLEVQKYFLEGAKDQFEIWIDHKNLEYFMKAQKFNQKQTRWALQLSRFDFTLKYVAGKSMRQVDGLSRRTDQVEGIERDNKNQVILKKEWLEIRVIKKEQLLIKGAEEEIIEKIKKSETKNDEMVKAVEEMKKEEMKKAGVKVLRNDE